MGANGCRMRRGECLCSWRSSVAQRWGVASAIFRTCAYSVDHSHSASQSVVLPSRVEPEQSLLLFSGRCLPTPGSPEHPGFFLCVLVLLGTNTQNPTYKQGPRVDRDPIPSSLLRVHFEEKQCCFGVCYQSWSELMTEVTIHRYLAFTKVLLYHFFIFIFSTSTLMFPSDLTKMQILS